MDMTAAAHMDLATWCRALGFTAEQLALNRTGAVDPVQMRGAWAVVVKAFGLLVLFGGVGVVTWAIARIWWRWVFLAGMVGFAAFYAVGAIQMLRDLGHPEAMSVEGNPVFEGGLRRTTDMRIGGRTFSFRSDLPDGHRVTSLLIPDASYRVYFLRHTCGVLSIEPVSPRSLP
jgi:hypothetical protein